MPAILLFLLIILTSYSKYSLAQESNSSFQEKNLSENQKDLKQVEKSDKIEEEKLDKFESIMSYSKKPSFIFDDEENNQIFKAVESSKDNENKSKDLFSYNKQDSKREENEKSYIYLGLIIYLSDSNWTVWINNQKITSANNNQNEEMYLDKVQKNKVSVIWRPSLTKWRILSGYSEGEELPKVDGENRVEIKFELKPNQTFILRTKQVVEGKVSPVVDKNNEEEKAPQDIKLPEENQ